MLNWFPSPRLRRPWLAVIALVLLIEAWGAWWGILRHFPYNAGDFAQYYFLGRFVEQGGALTDPTWPYQVGIRWQPWAYNVIPYLPYQMLLLLPMRWLAHLPYLWAVALWITLGIAAWLGAAHTAARVLPWSPRQVAWLVLLWPVSWLLLGNGNIDLFLGAGMVWALAALALGHARRSGYLFAWLAAFKPPLLLGVVPALKRHPRATLQGLLLGGGSAVLWAWLSAGSEGLRFFTTHLDVYSRNILSHTLPINGSFHGLVAAWVAPPVDLAFAGAEGYRFHGLLPLTLPVSPLATALGFGLLAALWWRTRRAHHAPLLEAGAWLTAATLVSPVGWVNYQIYLLLPLLCLLHHATRLPAHLRYTLAALLPFLNMVSLWLFPLLLVAPLMFTALGIGLLRLALLALFVSAWLAVSPRRMTSYAVANG